MMTYKFQLNKLEHRLWAVRLSANKLVFWPLYYRLMFLYDVAHTDLQRNFNNDI